MMHILYTLSGISDTCLRQISYIHLDFVGTGGGWHWVVVVDGDSGGISLFPNIFVQLFIIYFVINTNKCNACVSI